MTTSFAGEQVDDGDAHFRRLAVAACPVMLMSPPTACTRKS